MAPHNSLCLMTQHNGVCVTPVVIAETQHSLQSDVDPSCRVHITAGKALHLHALWPTLVCAFEALYALEMPPPGFSDRGGRIGTQCYGFDVSVTCTSVPMPFDCDGRGQHQVKQHRVHEALQ